MYKNPLNNGKLSDNNSLKKQRDYGSIIKKYENIKLETKPTELQKYYQYLTYQQPILDELNYVAERMRNEDIKTKTDDYNFIEDLKIKRENQMKENSQREESIKKNRDSLFDYSSTVKQDDMTPVINTDIEMEMETPIIKQQQIINNKEEIDNLMGDLFDNIFDEMSIADTVPIKEEKFELSKEGEKKSKAKKKREGRKKAKEIKAKEIEEKSAVKIENAILGKVKRNRAKKELISLKMDKANDVIGQINNEKKEIVKNKSNAVSMANDMVDNLFSETIKNIPEKNKRGRKKKIKN
jgi:hypothetical protein